MKLHMKLHFWFSLLIILLASTSFAQMSKGTSKNLLMAAGRNQVSVLDPYHYASRPDYDSGATWTADKLLATDWTTNVVAWLPFPSNQSTNYIDYSIISNANWRSFTSAHTPAYTTLAGGSLLFNGVDDVIAVETTATLRPSNSIVLSAWVLTKGAPVYGAIISKRGVSPPYYDYLLHIRNGTNVAVWLNVDGVLKQAQDGYSMTTGVWHHVVGMYDGTNISRYVDGVQISTNAPVTGSLKYATDTADHRMVCIGAWNNQDPLDFMFKGYIDDVQIRSKPLSSNEIYALYQLGSTNFGGTH